MLTPEEIQKLKSNPDKDLAALGVKLEQESEKYIPKSRFDEVNDKRKQAEEALQKRLDEEKKAAEAKALEDGKVKELLTLREQELEQERKAKAELELKAKQLDEITQRREEEDKKLRTQALEKIQDKDLRAIAEKLPTTADVLQFVDKMDARKVSVHHDRRRGPDNRDNGEPKVEEFKNLHEYEAYLRSKGRL
jgi:hypothetical protein